jgi:hypothetical protein
MRYQWCCHRTEHPVVDLQPLNFEPKKDDGKEAVFLAVVYDRQAPGAPEYALTVTMASPGEKGGDSRDFNFPRRDQAGVRAPQSNRTGL